MLILERIVSVIGPVFLIIAIGYVYGLRHRPDLKTFNHVSLHILGPLLVFTSLAGEDFRLAATRPWSPPAWWSFSSRD